MLVMSFIVHIFVALFICSHIPFAWLLNDFTEAYSYLWMAVYVTAHRCACRLKKSDLTSGYHAKDIKESSSTFLYASTLPLPTSPHL